MDPFTLLIVAGTFVGLLLDLHRIATMQARGAAEVRRDDDVHAIAADVRAAQEFVQNLHFSSRHIVEALAETELLPVPVGNPPPQLPAVVIRNIQASPDQAQQALHTSATLVEQQLAAVEDLAAQATPGTIRQALGACYAEAREQIQTGPARDFVPPLPPLEPEALLDLRAQFGALDYYLLSPPLVIRLDDANGDDRKQWTFMAVYHRDERLVFVLAMQSPECRQVMLRAWRYRRRTAPDTHAAWLALMEDARRIFLQQPDAFKDLGQGTSTIARRLECDGLFG